MTTVGPAELEAAWRAHSRKVLATLIRLLRDFDLTEEALHDAFLAAAQRWPVEGLPANPSAWLVSAGRFRAIDKLRRKSRHGAAEPELALLFPEAVEIEERAAVADDQLRLIFTCCHPELPHDAQVALTLREVCGLTTEEIARAFLIRPPALAQRIVRAKQRIRDAGLPYEIPSAGELPARLDSVLKVIYLVFNEGYAAHQGDQLVRADLSSEAIRLGRLVAELIADGEVYGLLGLMLLNDARRSARQTAEGDLVLLADQDRTLWDRQMIAEGLQMVERAFATRQIGPYALQGAIAAVHASAPTAAETDWQEILGLYGVLERASPSPVVRLNRAIALSMVSGPQAALDLIEPLMAGGELASYHLAHVARGEMLRQLGRTEEAVTSFRTALELTHLEPEKRQLRRRLADLGAGTSGRSTGPLG